MIRAIGNKPLYLADHEFSYANDLKLEFGNDVFNGIFESDDNGIVLFISPSPSKNTPMAVIFFMLNVMMNQKLMTIDSFSEKINEIARRVDVLEEAING